MAKAKTPAAVQPTAVIARPTPPMPNVHITLDLHPTAHAAGVKALSEAQGIVISDKVSHEAARSSAKAWKGTKREVEAWYRDKMVTPLYKAYKWASEQMTVDLALLDQAVAKVEGLDIAYTREQERLEREAADRLRREAEAAEQARRDQEAAAAESQALALEASSDDLSARERYVVEALTGQMLRKGTIGPADWITACKGAGYKDPQASWKQLIKAAKVTDAINAGVEAAHLRQAALIAAQKPIIVETPAVESQIGKVGGASLRTYWSCGAVDLKALVKAAAADERLLVALQPNAVYLDAQARALKENFERVFPFATVSRRDGVAS